MAEGRAESPDIKSSVCQIRTQVPGNELATTGSGCVLTWPWKIEDLQGHDQGTTQTETANSETTFIVTTSQVVTKSDLKSTTAWKAQFLHLKWVVTDEFRLNNIPVYEVSIPCQNHEIALILISTESLRGQTKLSWFRGNELQFARSQLCHQRGSKAPNAKQTLYCYVLSESASSNDKFALRCYLLCKDERGTYFLQPRGNKAELRTLKEFQPTENPKGSVILDVEGIIVGFLAFNDNDDNLFPLFIQQNLQDDDQLADVKSITHYSNTANEFLERYSSSNGNESERDANQNRPDNNDFPSLSIKTSQKNNLEAGDFERESKTSTEGSETSLQSAVEDQDQEVEFKEDDLPYLSQARGGNGENDMDETESRSSGDGEEGRDQPWSRQSQSRAHDENPDPDNSKYDNPNNEVTISGRATASRSQDPEVKAPSLMRSYSEQMTRRTHKNLFKSRSAMPPIPLKPGALVGTAVIHNVFVMDTLSRYLDMSCKGMENWRHLANLNGVSTNLQLKCESGERHCRSEVMFDVLSATHPDLRLGTLKQHLRDLNVNDVEHYIGSLRLDDDMEVQQFLESADLSIPGRVLVMLDLLPEETWQNLGVNLGVDREKLKRIKIDCANQQQNPASHVMNLIKSSQTTMTIGQFKRHLTNIERSDVAKTLGQLPEDWTISNLCDDLNLMRQVTSMLNGRNNLHLKNYKDLADECGFSSELYESLQPPCADSPTRVVIVEIVRHRPTFTVEELLINLRDMKRLDVIEAISRYFVGKK